MVRIALELATSQYSAAELQLLADAAESRGFESVWLSEDHVRDAISLLGVLAATTRTLRVATGPISMYVRTPYLTAMTAATLAETTAGRFILGLSPSHTRPVEQLHGVTLTPLGKGGAHLREIVGVIQRLLNGEEVTFEGTYIRITDARLPVRSPTKVPIYLNARVPDLLRTSGEIADGVNLSIATPDWVRDVAIGHLREGAALAGRTVSDVDIAYHPILCQSDDEGAAVAAARSALEPYLRNAEVVKLLSGHGFNDEMAQLQSSRERGEPWRPSEDLVRAVCLVGTRRVIRDRIDEYLSAGVKLMILRPQRVGDEDGYQAASRALDLYTG